MTHIRIPQPGLGRRSFSNGDWIPRRAHLHCIPGQWGRIWHDSSKAGLPLLHCLPCHLGHPRHSSRPVRRGRGRETTTQHQHRRASGSLRQWRQDCRVHRWLLGFDPCRRIRDRSRGLMRFHATWHVASRLRLQRRTDRTTRLTYPQTRQDLQCRSCPVPFWPPGVLSRR